MVNTGKPSGGCDVCKKRKIKCDETKPFCKRCEKAGRQCTGVPEVQVLAFRNASSASRRASPAPSRARVTPARSVSVENVLDPEGEFDDPSTSPTTGPAYPIECQAVALFMNDYQSDQMMPRDSRLLVKPMLFTKMVYVSATSVEAVHPAVAAPAIDLLATYTKRPELRVWSMRKYGEAIRMIQTALQDPEYSLTDGTLQGILVLKLCEGAITATHDPKSMYSHNAGISAVVKRRGQRNFSTPWTLQLFRAYRSHLIVSVLENEESPEPLNYADSTFDWFADQDLPDETEINTNLVKIAHDLTWIRFRADMTVLPEEPEAQDQNTLLGFVSQLRALDARLDQWFETLPEEWWPSVVPTSPIQSDVWSAYIIRVIIHDKAMEIAHRIGRDPPQQHLYSIRAAADSFCATVPYLFGTDASGNISSGLDPGSIHQLAWLRGGIGASMRWISIVANCSSAVPLEQRQWLKTRLETAAIEASYDQARILAEQIRL